MKFFSSSKNIHDNTVKALNRLVSIGKKNRSRVNMITIHISLDSNNILFKIDKNKTNLLFCLQGTWFLTESRFLLWPGGE